MPIGACEHTSQWAQNHGRAPLEAWEWEPGSTLQQLSIPWEHKHDTHFAKTFVCTILYPEPTGPLRRAAAVVSVDSVHTNASVLTLVGRTVIDVPLAGAAFKTWSEKNKRQ